MDALLHNQGPLKHVLQQDTRERKHSWSEGILRIFQAQNASKTRSGGSLRSMQRVYLAIYLETYHIGNCETSRQKKIVQLPVPTDCTATCVKSKKSNAVPWESLSLGTSGIYSLEVKHKLSTHLNSCMIYWLVSSLWVYLFRLLLPVLVFLW